MKIYHDEDADLSILKNKTIAVLGYGIQGSAQALCLKDSGLNVVVGARQGGASWKRAKADGHKVMELWDAAKAADIICLLTPDMTQKDIYYKFVHQHLKDGATLYFSHGLNITFNQIKPPKNVDVIMVAPKAPGLKLRETYQQGFGVPALLAIHQDFTGKARKTGLALAKAMNFTKAGVFECTFDQETVSYLFGEQVVLCGGSAELIKAAFETLVEDGFPPELAYFECLHELKLILDLIYAGGIEYMWSRVSETARYGGRTRGKRVINKEVKARMKEVLEEIKNGTFAHEWISEYNAGLPKFEIMKRMESQHQVEKVGAEIRKLFDNPEQKKKKEKTEE
ncbi:ketol-acid reductoisomerase [Candidatus Micrarchaeota archaeon]|nr:ketol-acid reductoisomerase [Candidatus Micrarchaeota archaeon]